MDIFETGLDLKTRTLFILDAEILPAVTDRVIKGLHLLSQKPGDIRILLNTEGGDVTCGLALFQYIQSLKQHVTIDVTGGAESIGAIILQAADWRRLYPTAFVMHHRGTYTPGESMTPEEAFTAAKFHLDLYNQTDYLVYQRWKVKNKDRTLYDFQELTRKSMHLFGQQAVDAGLADEVIK